jgi:hypothetical protein
MWKIVAGVVLAVVGLRAQPYQEFLLPLSRHITGTVVDVNGKPVFEAQIGHTNDRRHTYQTDSEGRFELDTRAPILVVRKAGFGSELVRTQDATEVRVTLGTENRVFPTCSGSGPFEGIDGWGASFQFPRTAGVTASPQAADSDYGARSYYVDTTHGPKGIMHGSGPLWSFGPPSDGDVWRSVKYEEVTFDAGRLTITDARGQFANGNRWRNLGEFGESASYSDIDEATAAILDRFLDGACLKPAPRR